MKFIRLTMAFSTFSVLLFLASCKKDDPQLPDNLIAFDSDQLGISSSESELTINLALSRPVSSSADVSVKLDLVGVAYGSDFTTDPAASAGIMLLTVPSGSSGVSFKVKKMAGILFDGYEKITFTIQSAGSVLVLGEKQILTLTFAEIVAASGTMELTGGGALFPNKVFIDLSGNRQTPIGRTSWDLGFSTEDDFRVILNSSNGMMVRALTKTDMNTVTPADTVGMGAQLSLDAVFAAITSPAPPAWVADAVKWIDDPTGDLTKTAMASVSATLSDNKVYIVNRGNGPGTPATKLGWKKIRVIRSGSSITLQHANIDATSFSEVQIARDASYRFQYVSFTTGNVAAEPNKAKWDFAWTGFANTTDFGSGPVPYYFQDVILQNIQGVQTVQVLTSTISYSAFTEANLAGLTFGTSQINIGSSWRNGGGPGVPPSLRTDRFYIIKDSDNNYYKVRFTALTTNGERGKPQLEFALVKKGS